jgi:Uma2 family endonuclease
MIAKTPQIVEHVVLYNVSWEAYEQLLECFGDRKLRHTYDNGTLEIMSPLKVHEYRKKLLARMIEATALELDMPIQSIGSTTLRDRPDRQGIEPDECYYVQHEAQVRGRLDYDPDRDPPPDLAIEVDVTHATLDRASVYARLKVPEIWVLRDNDLSFYRLSKGAYRKISQSSALPILSSKEVSAFLHRPLDEGETSLIRDFVKWVRKVSKQAE